MSSNIWPTTPGAIIGYRKNGSPIRLIAGGSGEGEGGDAGTSNAGQEGGTGGSGSTGTSTSGSGGGGGGGGGQQAGNSGTSNSDPAGGGGAVDRSAQVIAAVREDFKTERTKRQKLEKDLADLLAANTKRDEETKARNLALAKALGIEVDETPDPEKLAADLKAAREQTQAEVSKAQARERELTVELHLLRQAAKHGANPELLADSRTFMAKVAKLDPASDSFADDLGDAIKAAVDANPAYKTAPATQPANGGNGGGSTGEGNGSTGAGDGGQQPKNGSKTTAPPARSGGEHNGSPGGNRQWTVEDVNRLPKTRAGNEQLNEAIAAGLLTDLGYSPPRRR